VTTVLGWDRRGSRPAAQADGTPAAAGGRRTVAGEHRQPFAGSLWRGGDAIVPALLAALGTTGVAICWHGAATRAAFRSQIPWTLGAFASFGVFVLGALVWVLVGLRRVRLGMRRLSACADSVFGLATATVRPSAAVLPAATDLVAVDGLSRAHRPDCLLVRGKAVRPITGAPLGACAPCPMCLS